MLYINSYYFTISGVTYQFSRLIDAANADQGLSVTTDLYGNVYFSGYYTGSPTLTNESGTVTLAFPNSNVTTQNTAFVSKFNSSGAHQFTRIIDSAAGEQALCVAADNAGNMYVGGYYNNTPIILDQGGVYLGTLPAASGSAAFVCKFDSVGRYQYARIVDSAGTDSSTSVACDTSGNMYFAGNYNGTPTIKDQSGTSLGTLSASSGQAGFVCKFSLYGSYLYSRILDSAGTESIQGITCDQNNNLYFAAFYNGTATIKNQDGTTTYVTLPASSGQAGVVSKFDSSGAYSLSRVLDSAGSDAVLGVTCDTSNNFIMCGNYTGTATIKNDAGTTTYVTLSASSGQAGFLSKFDSTGAHVFSRVVDSAGTESIQGATCDISGSVYFGGFYNGTATIKNDAGTTTYVTLPASSGQAGFLSKFDSAGNYNYSRIIDSGGTDSIQGVACDSSGNLYCTGYYTGNPIIYTQTGTIIGNLPASTTNAAFLIQFDTNGNYNTQQSGFDYGLVIDTAAGGSAFGTDVVTDYSGNLYISGYYNGTSATIKNQVGTSLGTFPSSNATSFAGFVSKFDPTGAYSFSRIIDSAGTEQILGVVCDSGANMYCAGYYQNTPIITNQSGTPLATLPASAGSNTAFFAKFDQSGTFKLARIVDSTGDDRATSVAIDSSGNVYLAGTYSGSVSIKDESGTVLSGSLYAPTGFAAFLIKFDSSGAFQYGRVLDSAGSDQSLSITCDSSGNVYMCGFYTGTPTIKDHTNTTTYATLTASTLSGGFVFGFTSSGAFIDCYTFDSSGDDQFTSVACDTIGNTYVAGYCGAGSGVLRSVNASAVINTISTPITSGAGLLYRINFLTRDILVRIVDGSGTDQAYGVTCDSNNNVYLVGNYNGTPIIESDIGMCFVTLPTSTGDASFVCSFNSNGVYQDCRIIDTTGTVTDRALNVCCDFTSKVYVAGYNVYLSSGTPTIKNVNGVTLGVLPASTNLQFEYPPAAMTGYSTTISGQAYGNGIYTTSASSYDNSVTDAAWCAFNKTTGSAFTSTIWGANGPYYNTSSTPSPYTGTNTTTIMTIGSIGGEWLDITLPISIQLTSYSLQSRNDGYLNQMPVNWYIIGSNDNGTSWYVVDNKNTVNTSWTALSQTQTFTCSSVPSYIRYRIVITSLGGATSPVGASGGAGFASIAEWRLYTNGINTIMCKFDQFLTVATPEFQYIIDSNSFDGTAGINIDSYGNYYNSGNYANAATITTVSGVVVQNIPQIIARRGGILNKYGTNGDYRFSRILKSSTGECYTQRVMYDAYGSIYISGSYTGTPTFYDQSGTSIGVSLPAASGSSAAYMSKFDNTGNHLFTRIVDSGGYDDMGGLSVDQFGNIFLSGACNGTPTVKDQAGTTLATFTSAFTGQAGYVCKFDSSGKFVIALSVDSSGSDTCNSVATDPSGNYFICGLYTTGVATIRSEIPSTTLATLVAPSGQGGYVFKMSVLNVFQFARIMDGGGSEDMCNFVSCDSFGNAYICGTYNQTPSFKTADGTSIQTFPTTLNQRTAYMFKIDPLGNFLFGRVVNSSTQACTGDRCIIGKNSFVMCGWYNGAPIIVDANNVNINNLPFPSATAAGGYAVKFDLNGAYINSRFINSSDNDAVEGLGIDSYDNILFGGYYYTSAANVRNQAGTTLYTLPAGTGGQTQYFCKANLQDISLATSNTNSDPYASYVTLLLHGNSLPFIDSSLNAATLTNNGSVALNTSTFKFGTGSMQFSGTNYLATTASTNYTFGSSDFTIEFWMNWSDNSVGYGMIGNASPTWAGTAFSITTYAPNQKNIAFVTPSNTSFNLISTNELSLNTWNHIAFVRNGNKLTLYVNGVADSNVKTALSGSIDNGSTPTIYIGADGTSSSPKLKGYLDEVRITKFARYTSNFTPQVAQFPDPVYTNEISLLLHADSLPFTDSSVYNATLTNTGSVTSNVSVLKFGTGSMQFNGTNYLTAPSSNNYTFGSGNFTIEYWMYPTASNDARMIGNANGSWASGYWHIHFQSASNTVLFASFGNTNLTNSTAISLNTWNHIAVCRSGNTAVLYVNGVGGTSLNMTWQLDAGTTNLLNIGWNGVTSDPKFTGNIDEVRVLKGVALYTSNFTPATSAFTNPVTAVQTQPSLQLSDPYYSNVSLLFYGDSFPFYDSSQYNATLTNTGSVALNTSTYKFGTGSMQFNRSNYLTTPSSINYALGSSDFTVEFWINFITYTSQDLFFYNRPFNTTFGTNCFTCGNNGTNKVTVGINNTGSIFGATTLTTGVWYHMAIVRNGTTLSFYLNGTLDGSTTSSAAIDDGTATSWTFGAALTGRNMEGYLDDFRVTKGFARYTTNFTPLRIPLRDEYIRASLVGYYDFSVAQSGTTVTDLSGSGNNLTWSATPTYVSNPPCAVMNGTITASSSAVFIDFTTNGFTMEVLFKDTGSNSGFPNIFAHAPASAVNAHTIQVNSSNQIYTYSQGSSSFGYGTLTTVNTTSWYHYVITCTSGGTYVAYLNGSSVVRGTVTSGSNVSGPIVFGYPTANLTGYIGLARIYTRALTGTEVTQNYYNIRNKYPLP